nr:hypothetical protein [Tanacetum cinerariifolium]
MEGFKIANVAGVNRLSLCKGFVSCSCRGRVYGVGGKPEEDPRWENDPGKLWYCFGFIERSLRATEASGSESTQEIPTDDPKEITKKDVQSMLEIVPVPEFKVEALQVKYPIIDWEIHTKGLDEEDFVALWNLVKERFGSAEPSEDKERALWVELKRLFKPDANDTVGTYDDKAGSSRPNVPANTIPWRKRCSHVKEYQEKDKNRIKTGQKREANDSLMEEIDLSFTPDDPMPLGIVKDDYDSERDILILEELLSNDSISLPKNESFYFDIPSSSRPPAKPPDGNT